MKTINYMQTKGMPRKTFAEVIKESGVSSKGKTLEQWAKEAYSRRTK
jgi:hypothetical protein